MRHSGRYEETVEALRVFQRFTIVSVVILFFDGGYHCLIMFNRKRSQGQIEPALILDELTAMLFEFTQVRIDRVDLGTPFASAFSSAIVRHHGRSSSCASPSSHRAPRSTGEIASNASSGCLDSPPAGQPPPPNRAC